MRNCRFVIICFFSFIIGCRESPIDTGEKNGVSFEPIVLFYNSLPADYYDDLIIGIDTSLISSNLLTLVVSYSGGCRHHEFRLFGSRSIIKTNPPQASIFLSHNANGDVCRKVSIDTLVYNLCPLKDYVQQNCIADSILLRIYEPRNQEPYLPLIVYNF